MTTRQWHRLTIVRNDDIVIITGPFTFMSHLTTRTGIFDAYRAKLKYAAKTSIPCDDARPET